MPQILDTHIHLWPSTATSSENHGWMTPDHFLAKRHGIQDYLTVASPKPDGFIYVETDRYLPSTTPSTSGSASTLEAKSALETYAKEPLSEVKFLRRIVEGKTTEGDGCDATLQQGTLMKGCVIWAPFHLSPPLFQTYLALAEEVAGPTLWPKVVGFRYLLQGKPPGEVASLLQSAAWMENICALGKGRGGKGWTFDVGVDTNRDGVEMLEEAGSMIQRVREKEKQERGNAKPVRFVINHLAKPPLSHSPSQPNPRWLEALKSLSPDENVYMKLSGAFNEFSAPTPSDVSSLLTALAPFLDHVFSCFENRVMFGSDWPVCNVGGPKGEQGNWSLWREVVAAWLSKRGDGEAERVWSGAGVEAYVVEM